MSAATSLDLLLLAAVAAPLLLVPFVLARWSRPIATRLAPLGATPALALTLVSSPRPDASITITIPWLLLGARLGVDAVNRPFLALTALLWLLSGAYALAYFDDEPARRRFFPAYLAAMTGNLGLVIALDAATFYLFFATMSFASYPLIVHARTAAARRAGRVYLVLVIAGEALLLAALLGATFAAGTLDLRAVPAAVARAPSRDVLVGLVFAGFGVKAGALGLHVWLPPAHSLAPTPASAVLSGAMIKAGLLGWLRFLPLGHAELPGWGWAVALVGIAAAFYGVVVGLAQEHPKAILAYSSVSQMGFMTLGVGLGLAAPGGWRLALSAIQVYALHHALNKGALFLGTGVAQAHAGDRAGKRMLVTLGLAIPALALAGAPLTSGALAKALLKSALGRAPEALPAPLDVPLSLAAAGTTVLMACFLLRVRETAPEAHGRLRAGLWVPWSALVVLGIAVGVAGAVLAAEVFEKALSLAGLWSSLWPVSLGAVTAFIAWWSLRRSGLNVRARIPPGDVLVLVEKLDARAREAHRERVLPAVSGVKASLAASIRQALAWVSRADTARTEARLGAWTALGLGLLLVLAVVAAALAAPWILARR